MELCERYLHYMSALCKGTMPAPPELALTAGTAEERAAQLQSALKSMSVPDFVRLYEEKQGELLGALLSGDQKTFELFRTEAPELRHLPAATYEWYSKNYLDRDYPLRFILMCNGVEFPDTPEEDK